MLDPVRKLRWRRKRKSVVVLRLLMSDMADFQKTVDLKDIRAKHLKDQAADR
jgi:hypothetical protein